MIDWLRAGPPGSAVDDVRVSDAVPDGDDAFRIRQTD
jgi:acylphosphatase